MRLLSSIVGLALLVATSAFAGDARFGTTALAVEGSQKAQTVFAPDTPKIVLHVQILDMPAGAKLTASWIAVKTAVAPPNYKIDAADVKLDKAVSSDESSFSMTKPNAGWPVGDYRVDLAINDKVAASVPFKVAK
jgi:hypothetical protein